MASGRARLPPTPGTVGVGGGLNPATRSLVEHHTNNNLYHSSSSGPVKAAVVDADIQQQRPQKLPHQQHLVGMEQPPVLNVHHVHHQEAPATAASTSHAPTDSMLGHSVVTQSLRNQFDAARHIPERPRLLAKECDWISEYTDSNLKRRSSISKDFLPATVSAPTTGDWVKKSIRRSWTISNAEDDNGATRDPDIQPYPHPHLPRKQSQSSYPSLVKHPYFNPLSMADEDEYGEEEEGEMLGMDAVGGGVGGNRRPVALRHTMPPRQSTLPNPEGIYYGSNNNVMPQVSVSVSPKQQLSPSPQYNTATSPYQTDNEADNDTGSDHHRSPLAARYKIRRQSTLPCKPNEISGPQILMMSSTPNSRSNLYSKSPERDVSDASKQQQTQRFPPFVRQSTFPSNSNDPFLLQTQSISSPSSSSLSTQQQGQQGPQQQRQLPTSPNRLVFNKSPDSGTESGPGASESSGTSPRQVGSHRGGTNPRSYQMTRQATLPNPEQHLKLLPTSPPKKQLSPHTIKRSPDFARQNTLPASQQHQQQPQSSSVITGPQSAGVQPMSYGTLSGSVDDGTVAIGGTNNSLSVHQHGPKFMPISPRQKASFLFPQPAAPLPRPFHSQQHFPTHLSTSPSAAATINGGIGGTGCTVVNIGANHSSSTSLVSAAASKMIKVRSHSNEEYTMTTATRAALGMGMGPLSEGRRMLPEIPTAGGASGSGSRSPRLVRQEHVREELLVGCVNNVVSQATNSDKRTTSSSSSPKQKTFAEAKQAIAVASAATATAATADDMMMGYECKHGEFYDKDQEFFLSEQYQQEEEDMTEHERMHREPLPLLAIHQQKHSFVSLPVDSSPETIEPCSYGFADRKERMRSRRRSRDMYEQDELQQIQQCSVPTEILNNSARALAGIRDAALEPVKRKPETMRSISEEAPAAKPPKPVTRRSLSHPEKDTQMYNSKKIDTCKIPSPKPLTELHDRQYKPSSSKSSSTSPRRKNIKSFDCGNMVTKTANLTSAYNQHMVQSGEAVQSSAPGGIGTGSNSDSSGNNRSSGYGGSATTLGNSIAPVSGNTVTGAVAGLQSFGQRKISAFQQILQRQRLQKRDSKSLDIVASKLMEEKHGSQGHNVDVSKSLDDGIFTESVGQQSDDNSSDEHINVTYKTSDIKTTLGEEEIQNAVEAAAVIFKKVVLQRREENKSKTSAFNIEYHSSSVDGYTDESATVGGYSSSETEVACRMQSSIRPPPPDYEEYRLVFLNSDSSSKEEEYDSSSTSSSSAIRTNRYSYSHRAPSVSLDECDWDYFESDMMPEAAHDRKCGLYYEMLAMATVTEAAASPSSSSCSQKSYPVSHRYGRSPPPTCSASPSLSKSISHCRCECFNRLQTQYVPIPVPVPVPVPIAAFQSWLIEQQQQLLPSYGRVVEGQVINPTSAEYTFRAELMQRLLKQFDAGSGQSIPGDIEEPAERPATEGASCVGGSGSFLNCICTVRNLAHNPSESLCDSDNEGDFSASAPAEVEVNPSLIGHVRAKGAALERKEKVRCKVRHTSSASNSGSDCSATVLSANKMEGRKVQLQKKTASTPAPSLSPVSSSLCGVMPSGGVSDGCLCLLASSHHSSDVTSRSQLSATADWPAALLLKPLPHKVSEFSRTAVPVIASAAREIGTRKAAAETALPTIRRVTDNIDSGVITASSTTACSNRCVSGPEAANGRIIATSNVRATVVGLDAAMNEQTRKVLLSACETGTNAQENGKGIELKTKRTSLVQSEIDEIVDAVDAHGVKSSDYGRIEKGSDAGGCGGNVIVHSNAAQMSVCDVTLPLAQIDRWTAANVAERAIPDATSSVRLLAISARGYLLNDDTDIDDDTGDEMGTDFAKSAKNKAVVRETDLPGPSSQEYLQCELLYHLAKNGGVTSSTSRTSSPPSSLSSRSVASSEEDSGETSTDGRNEMPQDKDKLLTRKKQCGKARKGNYSFRPHQADDTGPLSLTSSSTSATSKTLSFYGRSLHPPELSVNGETSDEEDFIDDVCIFTKRNDTSDGSSSYDASRLLLRRKQGNKKFTAIMVVNPDVEAIHCESNVNSSDSDVDSDEQSSSSNDDQLINESECYFGAAVEEPALTSGVVLTKMRKFETLSEPDFHHAQQWQQEEKLLLSSLKPNKSVTIADGFIERVEDSAKDVSSDGGTFEQTSNGIRDRALGTCVTKNLKKEDEPGILIAASGAETKECPSEMPYEILCECTLYQQLQRQHAIAKKGTTYNTEAFTGSGILELPPLMATPPTHDVLAAATQGQFRNCLLENEQKPTQRNAESEKINLMSCTGNNDPPTGEQVSTHVDHCKCLKTSTNTIASSGISTVMDECIGGAIAATKASGEKRSSQSSPTRLSSCVDIQCENTPVVDFSSTRSNSNNKYTSLIMITSSTFDNEGNGNRSEEPGSAPWATVPSLHETPARPSKQHETPERPSKQHVNVVSAGGTTSLTAWDVDQTMHQPMVVAVVRADDQEPASGAITVQHTNPPTVSSTRSLSIERLSTPLGADFSSSLPKCFPEYRETIDSTIPSNAQHHHQLVGGENNDEDERSSIEKCDKTPKLPSALEMEPTAVLAESNFGGRETSMGYQRTITVPTETEVYRDEPRTYDDDDGSSSLPVRYVESPSIDGDREHDDRDALKLFHVDEEGDLDERRNLIGPSGGNATENVTVVTGSSTLSAVICLEDGLADDDSWVEEISQDEEEFATTTTATDSDMDDSSEEMTFSNDREEELRGYNRAAIDFTLHTIVEESCEESEIEWRGFGSSCSRHCRRGVNHGGEAQDGDVSEDTCAKDSAQRPSASELEKYFFYGLGGDVCGVARPSDSTSAERQGRFGANANVTDDQSELSEESSSLCSEGHDSLGSSTASGSVSAARLSGASLANHDPRQGNSSDSIPDLASSRLEKYFLTGFLGYSSNDRAGGSGAGGCSSDGSGGSVGSDSEGHASPEQRRKRLVRARGATRSHSSLDNLLLAGKDSEHSHPDSNTGAAVQSNSSALDPGNSLLPGGSGSAVGSGDVEHSSETDTCDESSLLHMHQERLESSIYDTAGKRKKKFTMKKSAEVISRTEQQQQSSTQVSSEPIDIVRVCSEVEEGRNSLQPPTALESISGGQMFSSSSSSSPQPVALENQRKQNSRDSGFIGSNDDLLKEEHGGSNLTTFPKLPAITEPRFELEGIQEETKNDVRQTDVTSARTPPLTNRAALRTPTVSAVAAVLPSSGPGIVSLVRKDSFNNWSSDEETNLMMSKMRQFFKSLVAASANTRKLPSSRSSTPVMSGTNTPQQGGSTPVGRPRGIRTKPPQLVYFENELTRLMKTVPGIRDEQVRELVEYLSSEDTWSDSYDSSDYTSSDLEGAGALDSGGGGNPFGLQEEISASCRQIISKFDSSTRKDEEGDIGDGGLVTAIAKSQDPLVPLHRHHHQHQAAQPQHNTSLGKETAFVYQRLVASLSKVVPNELSKTEHDSKAIQETEVMSTTISVTDKATPHVAAAPVASSSSSPPLITKVMHHIGSRLVALMHEVSTGDSHTSVSPKQHRIGGIHRKAGQAISVTGGSMPLSSGSTLSHHHQFSQTQHLHHNVISTTTTEDDEDSSTSDSNDRSHSQHQNGAKGIADYINAVGVDDHSSSPSYATMLLPRSKSHDLLLGDQRSAGQYHSGTGSCDIVGEERGEASDYERFSWRGSFESALLANGDSRTKLSMLDNSSSSKSVLVAKRRSAGDLLFNNQNLSQEQLDRVRSCGSIGGHREDFETSKMWEARQHQHKHNQHNQHNKTMQHHTQEQNGLATPGRRRTLSSVAADEEDTDSDGSCSVGKGGTTGNGSRFVLASRSTLPRSLQNTMTTGTTNSLPRLPTSNLQTIFQSVASSSSISSSSIPHTSSALTSKLSTTVGTGGAAEGVNVSMAHKSQSVYHFLQNNVKSARYRAPGFNRPISAPKRAMSAPGLGLQPTYPRRERRSRLQQQLNEENNSPDLRELTTAPGGDEEAYSGNPRMSVSKLVSNERANDESAPNGGSGTLPRGTNSIVSSPVGSAGGGSENWPSPSDEDIDRLVALHQNRASLSSLGLRSDSMASVYSGAGEGRYGTVTVRGQIEFGMQYNYKQGALEIHVKQCRELAAVDTKRNRSDPYVKVYLLPDKSKSGKRKTKVKKHTLNPVFDEVLRFHMSLNNLQMRTIWLTVWHSDMFGRNDFLGEVMMGLQDKVFDNPQPQWYQLQERSEPFEDLSAYKGDIIVGLKYVSADMDGSGSIGPGSNAGGGIIGIGNSGGGGGGVGSGSSAFGTLNLRKFSTRSLTSSSSMLSGHGKGALHVLVKEAKHLQPIKSNGTCDAFCKSYLLPDKNRSSKQKTPVIKRTNSPVWNYTFVYEDVSLMDLSERALELTIWDHDRLSSNEFLGGVRFSLGNGKHNGRVVEWMDSTGKELSLWQNMINRPNFWVEGALVLRPSLENARFST